MILALVSNRADQARVARAARLAGKLVLVVHHVHALEDRDQNVQLVQSLRENSTWLDRCRDTGG